MEEEKERLRFFCHCLSDILSGSRNRDLAIGEMEHFTFPLHFGSPDVSRP